jgi:hypothetical protein
LEHDGENRRHGTPDGYRTETISMIGRGSGRGQSLPVRKTYQIVMASRRHPEVFSFVQDVTKSGAQGRNRTLAYRSEILRFFY